MIVIKFKKAVIALILSVIFVFLVVGVPAIVSASSPAPEFVVVLDAGHGGIDGGVVGVNSGICERELNMIITYKVKALLEKRAITI